MDVRVRINEGYKLYWRGRDRVAGEVIEVPEKEARLIVATKKGSRVVAVPVPDPQPLASANLQAEEQTTDETPKRRSYKRRDLRAEE